MTSSRRAPASTDARDPIDAIASAYRDAQILFAANRLGVFPALAGKLHQRALVFRKKFGPRIKLLRSYMDAPDRGKIAILGRNLGFLFDALEKRRMPLAFRDLSSLKKNA